MASPLFAGVAVAGAAMVGRYAVNAYRVMMLRTPKTRVPRQFAGGFESEMSRKEALRVLNVREGSSKEQVRDSHRRLMLLNHPDNGGSTFIASKVNEAKDMLLGTKRSGRAI
ncbi:hypothetical protein NDN08_004615 [Rhodosorus marinus]|uniref:J domain-containing protein n=1 Tax=Rhodosorus marinus TaxID=101924 RepID=A0AAV8UM36_9RHOD|nr:hypothetical protein NDN08_004615 [Rhodosorus marinus]|mmetsp:Transcript_6815/g.9965  ORF Transcript_6815/g.9965 Transcript_6815/m.9965 type:complete len:112 (-) Transcript_6815:355-690(-)|eukprot:CAMPEP_0184742444 /NCGR_PEP_ID=MMETSP0315-20130426/5369_1 /TAXON_ID=101924 /ORGANISM="Rhodosorus marinus, Strain UTEX LB 2760" /LENGTH=111 /DNA_ID=CAMNT_0027213239 /DNA_START=293 /DNA_END=628 /DNA_ORIENTATION=+